MAFSFSFISMKGNCNHQVVVPIQILTSGVQKYIFSSVWNLLDPGTFKLTFFVSLTWFLQMWVARGMFVKLGSRAVVSMTERELLLHP